MKKHLLKSILVSFIFGLSLNNQAHSSESCGIEKENPSLKNSTLYYKFLPSNKKWRSAQKIGNTLINPIQINGETVKFNRLQIAYALPAERVIQSGKLLVKTIQIGTEKSDQPPTFITHSSISENNQNEDNINVSTKTVRYQLFHRRNNKTGPKRNLTKLHSRYTHNKKRTNTLSNKDKRSAFYFEDIELFQKERNDLFAIAIKKVFGTTRTSWAAIAQATKGLEILSAKAQLREIKGRKRTYYCFDLPLNKKKKLYGIKIEVIDLDKKTRNSNFLCGTQSSNNCKSWQFKFIQ